MTEREVSGATSSLIQFDSTGPTRRRLYCFPFAGGGPATYRQWPTSLPPDVEVVVVVLPGRDPRTRAPGELPIGTMSALLPPTLDSLTELQNSSPLPFAFFGHSMGTLVAYEIAVELEQRAQASAGSPTPNHLFVSGRRPPDHAHNGPRIHELNDDDFIDAMQRNYGGIPDVVRNEPDLMALFIPGLRADVQLFETYSPSSRRTVVCPVRVYGGDGDPKVAPTELPHWQHFSEREISIRTFPGGHFYLNDARVELCSDIGASWDAAEAGAESGRDLRARS